MSVDCACKSVSIVSQLGVAGLVGLIFVVFSLPIVFKVTTVFFGKSRDNLFDFVQGKPKFMGLIYHASLILLLVLLLQQPWRKGRWICATKDDKTVPCGPQVRL